MIRHPKRFASWLPALFDGEFQWDFLLPAWKGTKIQPMDFDAVIERRGHVLIFETKVPGKSVDLGQQITLTDQWRKGATVMQLVGKSPDQISGYAIYREGEYTEGAKFGTKPIENCDAYDVVFYCRRWFCWASGLPVPTRDEWDHELWVWDYERSDVA